MKAALFARQPLHTFRPPKGRCLSFLTPDQMVGIEVFDSRNLEDASLDLTWRSQILRDVKC